jgi:hypothetical protein
LEEGSQENPVVLQLKIFILLAAITTIAAIMSALNGYKKLFYAFLVILLVSPYLASVLVAAARKVES